MSKLSESPHRSPSSRRPLSEESFSLEVDLRSTDWILEKVRKNSKYAQNLYSALCNNRFRKTNIENTPENLVKILSEDIKWWSCSWRYAGGIISDMREQGDYLDWYCSGMGPIADYVVDENKEDESVPEGCVTLEIREDLNKLGWIIEEDEDDN